MKRKSVETYRAVIQWRTADGDRGESGRLRARGLNVSHAVRRTRAVHVDRRSGRVGVGEAGGPRRGRRVRWRRGAEALRCRGRCRLVVVHHCEVNWWRRWGGRLGIGVFYELRGAALYEEDSEWSEAPLTHFILNSCTFIREMCCEQWFSIPSSAASLLNKVISPLLTLRWHGTACYFCCLFLNISWEFSPDRACVSRGVLLFGVSCPFVMSTVKEDSEKERERERNKKSFIS